MRTIPDIPMFWVISTALVLFAAAPSEVRQAFSIAADASHWELDLAVLCARK